LSTDALQSFSDASALLAVLGLVAALVGTGAAMDFVRRAIPAAAERPPMTILKPLCGDEPLLELALTTFFQLDYPAFQLVFGVQDPSDPALAIVDRLRRRFPNVDMAVVVDPALHGLNRKVSNLMNMLPHARHELLVFADSDLHVTPDYLTHLGDALAQPGVGLVTTLSAGRPGVATLAATLGSMQISHAFLPGVLMSRLFGRQDCLGTTMALTRRTLGLAGGLAGLVDHLADDHVLGRRVKALGLRIELASVITATTVSEQSFPALWAHELRWARTMGALEPLLFLSSALQYPLFWAGLAFMLSGGRLEFAALFAAAWAARGLSVMGVAWAIGRAPGASGFLQAVWSAGLAPARDALSIAVLAASYCGDQVTWRGHVMRADNGMGWPVADRFVSPTAAASAIIALTEEAPR
jgi:ceramide glucosyltransferase